MPSTKRKPTYDLTDPFIASDSGSPPHKPSSSASSLHPSKRSKPAATTTTATTDTVPSIQQDDEGNRFWSISPARRVTVSDFKGKKMISVREYYEKDGTWLPGKKGITMTLEQYSEFLKVLPMIEMALGPEGKKVGRPIYPNIVEVINESELTHQTTTRKRDGKTEGDIDDENDDEGENGHSTEAVNGGGGGGGSRSSNKKLHKKENTRKANIEATSDEDEG